MSAKQSLVQLLEHLPEEKVEQILRFARNVSDDAEMEEWSAFGLEQLSRAYGPDEPVYTLNDLKPDPDQ
jgi:hypothetical protein